ncbi:unnamed protein product [Musa textilis]
MARAALYRCTNTWYASAYRCFDEEEQRRKKKKKGSRSTAILGKLWQHRRETVASQRSRGSAAAASQRRRGLICVFFKILLTLKWAEAHHSLIFYPFNLDCLKQGALCMWPRSDQYAPPKPYHFRLHSNPYLKPLQLASYGCKFIPLSFLSHQWQA